MIEPLIEGPDNAIGLPRVDQEDTISSCQALKAPFFLLTFK